MGHCARSTCGCELEARRPRADDLLVDRSVVWIFIAVGSTVGGLAPEAWGGSAFGVASLALGCLGGLAGVWLAARLAG